MTWIPGRAALTALVSLLAGCTFATPYRHLQAPDRSATQRTAIVVLTHVVVDNDKRAPFDEHTRRVIDSLADQPGMLGYSVRRQIFGNEAWTMTVWRDENSRARFVASTVHRSAIAASMPALKSVRTKRLELPLKEIPMEWARALQLLEQPSSTYGGEGNVSR